MDQPHAASTRIGDCVLDRARGTLMRGGEMIAVRAKTFALLTHLADNRGRVISKDELLTTIWPGVIVSEDSLTQCVRDLRKALGDEEQKWLRTVSRRGYLLANETVTTLPSGPPSSAFNTERVVAVLPFAIVGDADPVLIDGVIEEITNGLSRFRTVTVIARASAFSFPVGQRPLPQIVGEKLGADHLVEGTFRGTSEGFRISVTLTHAPTARQIWNGQFQCAEADLIDIDAVIARRVIGGLVSNIEESVLRLNTPAAISSLKAFECLARGRMYLRGYGDEANANAVSYLRRSVEIDPNFGLAQAYLAFAEVIQADFNAAPRPILEAARSRAALALALAPEESRCHRIMALIQLWMREYGSAETHIRQSISLNPLDVDALAQMGYILTMRGQAEEGLRWLERAIELNPFRPPWYDENIAFSYYALGRYGEAAASLSRVPEIGSYNELRLAAACAMAGDLARAVHHIRRAYERQPDLKPRTFMQRCGEFEYETDLDHLLDGIARAEQAASEAP